MCFKPIIRVSSSCWCIKIATFEFQGANQMEVGGSDFQKWDELIPDALALIFNKLSLQEKLTVVPKVCKAWAKAVQGPYCWQEIDIDEWSSQCRPDQLIRMLWLLLPRSQGSLHRLQVSCVNNDQAFAFIAQHAESLQTLTLRRSQISDSIIEKVAENFSAITSLDLSYCSEIGVRALEAIGKNCKLLSVLSWSLDPLNPVNKACHLEEVHAIAKTMPKLKRLELANLLINNESVLEILSSCPELESLDLSRCLGFHLDNKFLEEKYLKLKFLGPPLRSTSDSDDDWSRWGCHCDYMTEDSDDEMWDTEYVEYLLDLGFNG